MGVTMNDTKILLLKYADDLVLISKSREGLQKGLRALKSFCNEKKLVVNSKKVNLCVLHKKQIN